VVLWHSAGCGAWTHSPPDTALSSPRLDSLINAQRLPILNNLNSKQYVDRLHQIRTEAHRNGDLLSEARALMMLGYAFYLQGRYAESVDAYLESIRIFEAHNSLRDLVMAYGDLGYHLKRQDLAKGRRYMLKAIHLAEKQDMKQALTSLYDNYGIMLHMAGKLDSAYAYYLRSLNLKRSLNDSVGISYSLIHLATLFLEQKNFAEARKYLEESDAFRQRYGGSYEKLENLITWGEFYRDTGQLDSAVILFERAVNYPAASDRPQALQYCLGELAQLHEKQGNLRQALEYLKRFQVLKDSLASAKTNARIAQLQIEYETEKKDRELARKELKIQERNALLAVTALIALLFMVAGGGLFWFQRVEIKRIQRQRQLEADLKKAEYERSINLEKLKISRELHDNIGSQLTFLINSLDNLAYLIRNPGVKEKLKQLSEFGRNTMSELRSTIWAMRAQAGSLEALVRKVNEFKLRWQGTLLPLEISIENHITKDIKLSSLQMINLFRVIQEAVQNSVKHAQCKSITVRFEPNRRWWDLVIKDDGCGFDTARSYHGNGLENMEQRCREAGGEFTIKSGPAGTEIRCRVPYNQSSGVLGSE